MALLSLALQPITPDDARRLDAGLQRLRAENPSIEAHVDKNTGWTVIGATSEAHLETIVDRLKREFDVSANIDKPQVTYKEMITEPATGQMKYSKQTRSRGEYAHVKLRLSPGALGSGCVFVSTVVGGAIPEEFIPAIDEGIREACGHGVLAGFPVDDIRVELYDGSYHDVDSSSFAFKVAASMAFHDGVSKGSPVVLEPIMRVDVTTPAEHTVDVVNNISMRRGEIRNREDRGGTDIIRARVPLAELFGYEYDLRSRTRGRGTCAIEFEEYRALPPGRDPDEPSSMIVGRPKGPTPRSSSASMPEPDETDDGE
jgi:elongation factor G